MTCLLKNGQMLALKCNRMQWVECLLFVLDLPGIQAIFSLLMTSFPALSTNSITLVGGVEECCRDVVSFHVVSRQLPLML